MDNIVLNYSFLLWIFLSSNICHHCITPLYTGQDQDPATYWTESFLDVFQKSEPKHSWR